MTIYESSDKLFWLYILLDLLLNNYLLFLILYLVMIAINKIRYYIKCLNIYSGKINLYLKIHYFEFQNFQNPQMQQWIKLQECIKKQIYHIYNQFILMLYYH